MLAKIWGHDLDNNCSLFIQFIIIQFEYQRNVEVTALFNAALDAKSE